MSRLLLSGILFISSMYFMSGCMTDPRILGVWTEKYSPGDIYLTFSINGTYSQYESDSSCSSSGRYLLPSTSKGAWLVGEITDYDPACGEPEASGFYAFVLIHSSNYFEMGWPMVGGGSAWCRTEGIGEPCIE